MGSNRKEIENETIRFPVLLIRGVNKAIENQDVTFSHFIIQTCEYTLENMTSDENISLEDSE